MNVEGRTTEGTLSLGGSRIPEGLRTDLLLPVSESYTGTDLSIPVTVVNGARGGPVLFVTAAIHGDELNGIAVVRDLLGIVAPGELSGALVCVPVVNVLGVQFHSRYLPDRRDLNRFFPGSPTGSAASRIAHTLMTEVVIRSSAGIDLHTASNQRMNVPQIRTDFSDPDARRLGLAFGAPFLLDASVRTGSLRHAAEQEGVPVLTFEGGQTLRFEPEVIAVAVSGILRVMATLGMIGSGPPTVASVRESDETHWVRADRGGILALDVGPGEDVKVGQPLWTVTGPFGRERNQQVSPYDGMVIGMTTLPLVNPGDAVVHIAVHGRRGMPWTDEPTDEEDVADDDSDGEDTAGRDPAATSVPGSRKR